MWSRGSYKVRICNNRDTKYHNAKGTELNGEIRPLAKKSKKIKK